MAVVPGSASEPHRAPTVVPRLAPTDLDGREDRDAYRARGGYAAGGTGGHRLIDEIEAAGLRGRGGAAFPTGLKMRTVAASTGPRYLVANGEEGEPASIKDRWLLRQRPHLVLDGMFRAARAIAAERCYVYVSDPAAAASIEAAIAELEEQPLPIALQRVAPAYVAGEETAAVRAINGGPALPLDKPPRPFEAGVEGQPTLVANVETLANLPGIDVYGAAAFRTSGTHASPGTFLSTISGACERPGLYELAFGSLLGEVLEDTVGLVGEPRGFLMGGFFGGILGPRAKSLPLDYDGMREQGSGLGCGAIVVLGSTDCPLAAAADLMSYFERESSNQCGACVRGTLAMRDVLFDLARGQAQRAQLERLRGWSTSLRGRGACSFLDGAAVLAASLLHEFPEEVDRHLEEACPRCAHLLGETPPEQTRFSFNPDSREEQR